MVVILGLLLAGPAAAQNVRRLTSTVPPASGGGAKVTVIAGQSIASAITAAGAGGVILLKAGTHRLDGVGAVTPLNDQVFIGERDSDGVRRSRINGARILTGWIPDSGRWYVTGQTQAGTVATDALDCDLGTPQHPVSPSDRYARCWYPEQLYFNCGSAATCTMKHHETALANVGAGEWFFDYAADRIYVGDDPTTHFVETSVVGNPFAGSATGVTVRGLVFEMFANTSQTGAVENRGANWLIDDNEIRWNHGAGVGVATATGTVRVRNNYIHHNCNYAIVGGGGEGITVDGNELAYNNVLPQSNDWETAPCGFYSFWGGGATKFVHTLGMVFKGNYSHHNNGPGAWFDIENRLGIVEFNRLEYNRRSGLFWELSCDVVIRYNWMIGNATGGDYPGGTTGAGIEVNTSANVEIHNNYVDSNFNGIIAYDDLRSGGTIADPGTGNCKTAGLVWKVAGLNVHDNFVISPSAGAGYGMTGVWDSGHGTDAFDGAQNNHFELNFYTLGTGMSTATFFNWSPGYITDSAWQTTYGHDDAGTISRP